MASTTSTFPVSASTTSSGLSSPTPSATHPVPAYHASPIVAFIIGLVIILLASILNAAGLNLTKLDHVRTKAIPKSQRRRDWLRPLWLLGMVLYILSQLIGSTLALEYLRAEYVAPLGSSSLIFNFLFARFLVGTPVTSTDIYGTVIVILGVIGIVAFGSINSGLASETDVAHITYLWRRAGWLGFFFCMSFALIIVGIGVVRLDAVLAERVEEDVAVVYDDSPERMMTGGGRRAAAFTASSHTFVGKMREGWAIAMNRVKEALEKWSARHDDQHVAWTLGIGWACLGGGLAGGCLVFAKAIVKLISGSLSHQNTGNQFGHAASIFTIILLCVTAVLQIICLNRGLRVYDSTLVVPVFYGIYTATGFLDSLIFNDEVDSYKSWTLFLIFVSILILISGVVLLTHKKPEPISAPSGPMSVVSTSRGRRRGGVTNKNRTIGGDAEASNLGEGAEAGLEEGGEPLWTIGGESDDEGGSPRHPRRTNMLGSGSSRRGEQANLIKLNEEEMETRSVSSDATLSPNDDHRDPFRDEPDDSGTTGWKGKSVR